MTENTTDKGTENRMKEDTFYIDGLEPDVVRQLNTLMKQLEMGRKDFLLQSINIMGAALDAEKEVIVEPIFSHTFNLALDVTVTSEGDMEGIDFDDFLNLLRSGYEQGKADRANREMPDLGDFKMPTLDEIRESLEGCIAERQESLQKLHPATPDHDREMLEAEIAMHQAQLKGLIAKQEEQAKEELVKFQCNGCDGFFHLSEGVQVPPSGRFFCKECEERNKELAKKSNEE